MIERIDLGIAGLTNIERIGSGGNAIVYRARQDDLDRDVVIKVLTNVDADTTRRRFDRERRAMGRLSQASGIAPLYGSGFTPGGQPYLLMPFYEHGSLQERLERTGALEPATVRNLGVAISRGVQTAHENGVLHRDLKPANILIRRTGEPDVADFGIAHLTDDSLGTSQALTMTPLYTAPEVFDGVESGAASDIYSVGATLYALLNGHAAHSDPQGGTPVLSLMRRINEDPLPALPPTVPKALEAVIARAMSKDPAKRQASAGELAAELAAADMTPPKVRAQRTRRTNSSAVIAAVAAVLLAVAGGAAAAFLLIDRSETSANPDPTETSVPDDTPDAAASTTPGSTPTSPVAGSVSPFDQVSAKSTAEQVLVRIEAFSCTGVDVFTGVALNDGIIITRDQVLSSPWYIDVIADGEILRASGQASETADGFAYIDVDTPTALNELSGVEVAVGDQVAIVGIDGRPALANVVAGDVDGELRAEVVDAGAGNVIEIGDAIVTDSGGLVGIAAVSPGVIDVVTVEQIRTGTSRTDPSYSCPSLQREFGPGEAESVVSPAIGELLTMQLLSDAYATEQWDLVREIEPGKVSLTDQNFVNGWRPLRQGFVYPVERVEQDGLSRWRLGLIGHETWNGNDLTTLFCVTWTVDPVSGVVVQTNEDSVPLFGSQPGQEQRAGFASPAELTDLIAARCPV